MLAPGTSIAPHSSSSPRVRVILDPRAQDGAALGKVALVEAALRRFQLTSEIVLLRSRGHAEELARAARADGVDVLAIAAGDAVLNEVVQTYVTESDGDLPRPDLALLPFGRGDFRRTFDLSGALEEAVARLRHGRRRAVDLGMVTCRETDGEREITRAFLNVASFGIEGEAGKLRSKTSVSEGLTRLVAAGRALGGYRPGSVRLSVDGAPFYEGPIAGVALANGRFFAGGLRIAPQADPTDGRLDVVVLGDLRRRDLLALAPRLVFGSHLLSEGVHFARGVRIEAVPLHAWAKVPVELDGEPVGELPLKAWVKEQAVVFRV